MKAFSSLAAASVLAALAAGACVYRDMPEECLDDSRCFVCGWERCVYGKEACYHPCTEQLFAQQTCEDASQERWFEECRYEDGGKICRERCEHGGVAQALPNRAP